MSMKWKKRMICTECFGTHFTIKKWRYDGFLDGKTYESKSCMTCDGTDVTWMKEDEDFNMLKPDLNKATRLARKFLQNILPNNIANELDTHLSRQVRRERREPFHTGRWDEGVCVPIPNTTGGYQCTGISSIEKLKESGWRADFTMEQYGEWCSAVRKNG